MPMPGDNPVLEAEDAGHSGSLAKSIHCSAPFIIFWKYTYSEIPVNIVRVSLCL